MTSVCLFKVEYFSLSARIRRPKLFPRTSKGIHLSPALSSIKMRLLTIVTNINDIIFASKLTLIIMAPVGHSCQMKVQTTTLSAVPIMLGDAVGGLQLSGLTKTRIPYS